jgi:hypothetical protein
MQKWARPGEEPGARWRVVLSDDGTEARYILEEKGGRKVGLEDCLALGQFQHVFPGERATGITSPYGGRMVEIDSILNIAPRLFAICAVLSLCVCKWIVVRESRTRPWLICVGITAAWNPVQLVGVAITCHYS